MKPQAQGTSSLCLIETGAVAVPLIFLIFKALSATVTGKASRLSHGAQLVRPVT